MDREPREVRAISSLWLRTQDAQWTLFDEAPPANAEKVLIDAEALRKSRTKEACDLLDQWIIRRHDDGDSLREALYRQADEDRRIAKGRYFHMARAVQQQKFEKALA